MERFEIFPLKIITLQSLLSFIGYPEDGHSSSILFNYLRQNGIAINFLAEGPAADKSRSLVLVVATDALKKLEAELEVLSTAIRAQTMIIERAVAVIRILGPHFDIRPGIAGLLYGRLEKAGIRILANATTITTSLLVVFENEVEQIKRELAKIFQLPKAR